MWENTYKVLEDYGVKLRNLYQDKLIVGNKIATGDLLNTCEYLIEKDNMCIQLSLQLEDYWKWVENGRSAGKFPPIDKIREWIRIKPIIPYEGKDGRLPTEKQLAFLISRKIAEQGIEAGNQLRDSISELKVDLDKAIEDAVSKDIQENLTIIFSEFFVK